MGDRGNEQWRESMEDVRTEREMESAQNWQIFMNLADQDK